MTTDPDEIRAEIRGTQEKLSGDVEALTDKVSPPRMVKRRAQRARAAVTGMKEKVMGNAAAAGSSAGDRAGSMAASARETVGSAASSARETVGSAASSTADAVSSAPEVARQRAQGNPLAAGLIAFAAGWLVSSLLPASTPEKQLATQVKETVTEKGRPVAQELGQAAREATEQLRDSARQAAESVKSTASDAASTVSDEARSAAGGVAADAQQAKDTVTDHAKSSGS